MRHAWLLLFWLPVTLLGGELRLGEAVWIGERWFQFAGLNPRGEKLWLYPHVDGVPEIFTEKPGAWPGSLDSRYDPSKKRFENLFHAGEAASEVLYGGLSTESKRPAARVLAIFLELYDQPQPPYYLRPHLEAIRAALTDADREHIAKTVAYHREILARLPHSTPRLERLAQPRPVRDADEYYRRLIADGTLDIVVCGGNLYAEAWGTYNSWTFTENFTNRLKKLGFRESGLRSSPDAVLFEKSVRLLNADIAVRVFATGASKQPARILRSVACFTEGFARADVFLYHGHSNKDEGAYYLSELSTEFPRFQIGMNDTRDLSEKLQGLHRRAHQIHVYQSCSSVEKYGYPIRAALDALAPNAHGHIGFTGNPTISQQVDFAPRYSLFVEELCKGTGPREIALRINALKPDPHSTPIAFRGVLQPRASFIVPKGVTLKPSTPIQRDGFFRSEAAGSDGRTYTSTDLFAQNAPGEIVQISQLGPSFFGLSRDGELYEASPATLGTMAPSSATRTLRPKIVQLCTDAAGKRLLLLCDDNTLRAFTPGDESIQHARVQPGKVKLNAVAFDAQKNFFGQRATGEWLRWNPDLRKWEPSAAPELSHAAPTLNGRGLQGELILE